jgi:hypothetical protein
MIRLAAIAFTTVIAGGALVALLIVGYTFHRGHLPAITKAPFRDGFDGAVVDERLWEIDADRDCRLEVVASPGRREGTSLLVDAPAGARCEVLPILRRNLLGKLGHEPRDLSLSYAFSTYIPPGQTYSAASNEVLAQWHGSPDFFLGDAPGRGPAVALRIEDGRTFLTSGWDDAFVSGEGRRDRELWSADLAQGTWEDWRFDLVWSHGEEGRLSVWRNGERVLEHRGPNSYNDLRNVYLKIGVYHPAFDRRVYFDDFRFEVVGP